MGAEVVAVVAGEDDFCVVQLAVSLQRRERSIDQVINRIQRTHHQSIPPGEVRDVNGGEAALALA